MVRDNRECGDMTKPMPATSSSGRKWWQRPIVWLATVVVGALGAYGTDALVSGMKSVVPTDDLVPELLGIDAIAVVDMIHLLDPVDGAVGYIVAGSVDPVPMLSGAEPIDSWTVSSGAVDVGVSAWEVTLEGKRESPVELVDITPVLEERCGDPLIGGLIMQAAQGETDKIRLNIDVPANRPTVTREEGHDVIENYFSTKKITLPKGEKNVLILRGVSQQHHCRWKYQLGLIADGKRITFLLAAPGDRPFEVTGKSSDAGAYDWVIPPFFCFGSDGPEKLKAPRGTDFNAFLNGVCS